MNDKGLMTRETGTFEPIREFSMLPALGGIFDELFAPVRAALPTAWMPRVDIHETEKEYVLNLALPGVKKEDVTVDVRDGVLSIAGERRAVKEEKEKSWLRKETSYGSFRRAFILPDDTHPEQLKAAYKDGVLTVLIPRPAHAEAKGIRIRVE